jgi:hypothetical protein
VLDPDAAAVHPGDLRAAVESAVARANERLYVS